MLAQDEGFHARLRAAVSGGRTVWPDGKRSALLLTYDMDAELVVDLARTR